MSIKSMALLIAGMMIISGVFFFFHIGYPETPAKIVITPPHKNQLTQLFQNQSYNSNKIGFNGTNFESYGNASILMEGYARNASAASPDNLIADSPIIIAMGYLMVQTYTDKNGYYSVQVLQSGKGTFAFDMFQYNILYKQVYFAPLATTAWVNLSFNPAQKFEISGYTQYNGSAVPDVLLKFYTSLGSYTTDSDSSGFYRLNMVNGTYQAVVNKTGFGPIPTPDKIVVAGSGHDNLNLTLHPIHQIAGNISGNVHNGLGIPLPGVLVADTTSNQTTYTDANGYYSVRSYYGPNALSFTLKNYYTLITTVNVSTPQTSRNVTLISFTNIPGFVNSSSSQPLYNSPELINLSGIVYDNQTGIPIPNSQFSIIVGVNGTYFIAQFSTNSTGAYSVKFNYPGAYSYEIVSNLTEPGNFSSLLKTPYQARQMGLAIQKNSIGQLHLKVTGTGGSGLSGSGVRISQGSGSIAYNLTNASGSYNVSLPKGTYYINISKPGYINSSQVITVSGNNSLNVSLKPSGSIGGNSSLVSGLSSLKNLPAITEQTISDMLSTNRSSGKAVTYNYNGTSFTFDLRAGSVSLVNTSVAFFLYVNGNEYVEFTSTNSNGLATLSFTFGGTYEVLPEATDFNGTILLLNTTTARGTQTLQMQVDRLGELNITLQNNFTIPLPPAGGLSVTNYLLPIYFNQSVNVRANLTTALYRVPYAEYNFTFRNSSFVPVSNVPVNLSASSDQRTIYVDPYLIILNYSTPISLNYDTTGAVSFSFTLSGSGQKVSSVVSGTYTSVFSAGTQQLNSTSFSITQSSFIKYMSFDVTSGHVNSSASMKWLIPPDTLYVNFTSNSVSSGELLFKMTVYNGSLYFPLDGVVGILINGASVPVTASGSNVTLGNYFMLAQNNKYNFSIEINDFSGNVNGKTNLVVQLDYYTWSLVG
ncbi:carboxypeptidase regulatory-like domain-containing protein [Thermoplasmatales archaeon AK]|nr:carboxypeptidase regulatory-like domain-containing protein [Thermoplasmatales archaeon AK]